jgi:hypothetical protein
VRALIVYQAQSHRLRGRSPDAEIAVVSDEIGAEGVGHYFARHYFGRHGVAKCVPGHVC